MSAPDAALIAACAAFEAFEARMHAFYAEPGNEDRDIPDEMMNALDRLQKPELDRIYNMRATTSEGIMARVRTLAVHGGDGGLSLEISHTSWSGRMVAALLRDAQLMAGIAVPAVLIGGEA